MDYFRRLIANLLFLLFPALSASTAFASFPASGITWGAQHFTGQVGHGSSAVAACTALASKFPGGAFSRVGPDVNAPTICYFTRSGWNGEDGARFSTSNTPSCPQGATLANGQCTCNPEHRQNAWDDGCYQSETVDLLKGIKKEQPKVCSRFGNPIYPLTGSKKEVVETGLRVGGQALRLTYDSARHTAATAAAVAAKDYGDAPSFGALWLSSLHRKLVLSPAGFGAQLFRGDGTAASFRYQGGSYVADTDSSDQLVRINGSYRYTDAASQSIETYTSAGQLTSLADAAGNTLSFTYSAGVTATAPAAGYLMQVTDQTGRSLRFEYVLPIGGAAATGGRVSRILNTAGQAIVPAYDIHSNLTSLTWEDSKTRQFLYENASFPWALTGVIDENNSRLSTFGYDSAGRAISTERAGGVNRFSVSYGTPPAVAISQVYDPATLITYRHHDWQAPAGVTLTTPNGQTADLGSALVLGAPVMTSISQPAGSGCAAATSASTYDVSGNVLSKDDFAGMRSCYAYEGNRPVITVEGLANTVACSTVLPTNAVLPTGSRKLHNLWHSDWNFTTKVAQPLSLTTRIYNGQVDPFNGNALASCAPVAAKTPDGKPIAVLCKQVEQPTTDSSGGWGFAAGIDTNAAQRVTSYTYDSFGRVLTTTDPLGLVTSQVYYGDTAYSDTPPPGSFDPHLDAVSLLLYAEGVHGGTTFIDSSVSPKAIAVTGGASISTSTQMFGSGSAAFSSGGYLSVPSGTAFDFGSAPFTVEFYLRPASIGAMQSLVSTRIAGVYSPFEIDLQGSSIRILKSNSTVNGWEIVGVFPSTSIAANVWQHVAVVGNGTSMSVYVNGVASTTTAAYSPFAAVTTPLYIGSGGEGPFTGNMDELRITKGVARYSANFTPPIQTFPNVGPTIDPAAVGHTKGDLQSITNAAGHVTQFTQYDRAGRVRQMVDPKGVITDTTYTPRGWIASSKVTPPGGTARATTFNYDNAGQLTGVVMPDATTLSYSYDSAHRLTGVTDTKGNTVTYTLDNTGNRLGEQVKDPQGNLQRNITRVYDALNRVQQKTGASN